MQGTMQNAGSYKQIKTSGNVMAIPCTLLGIFVSSASATPTIAVYDDAATGTSTQAVDTFTPTGATYYPLNISLAKGANIVFGGTVSATAVIA